MTMTRTGIANAIDDLDKQIADLQTAKADLYAEYREDLASTMRKAEVSEEIAALKKAIAIRRRRTSAPHDEAEREARVEDIVDEISRPSHARGARTIEIIEKIPPHDPETGEIDEPEAPASQPTAAEDVDAPAAVAPATESEAPTIADSVAATEPTITLSAVSASGDVVETTGPVPLSAFVAACPPPPPSEDDLEVPTFLRRGHPDCVVSV